MLCAAGAGERRGDPVSVPSAGKAKQEKER